MHFISDISFFWILPILASAGGLTFWFYRNQSWMNEISVNLRRTLVTLRFLALTLLGILLLGILIESKDYRTEKPIFISLIDNSSSLKNYKDSGSVSKQIHDFQAQLKTLYGDKFELVTYTVGANFKAATNPTLSESKSNLADGFDQIFTQYYNRNIGGIAFISDGNFNEGSNPIYSAEKIALTPIFTLGVGDTIPKKDQLIRDISSNEIAFLKNKFPVEVDVEALKIGKQAAQISVYHNGKVVANQTVRYENGTFDFKHVTFELEATEIGFQHYSVEVRPIAGEYTTKNNRRSFYIEVLDGRNKILVLAGAPHPDVAALKYVLQKDENVQVESSLVNDWNKNLDKVDLVIWHEPGINFNPGILDLLARSGKPILYVIGPNTGNTIVQKLDVGLSVANSSQTDEVQAGLNTGFELFQLSTDLQAALRFYPPVKLRYGEVKLAPQNKVMLTQRLGEFSKNDPVLFFGEKNAHKYGVFFGEGMWRWKLTEFAKTQSTPFFEEFIQKITQYLVVKQNASLLRVTLPRRFTRGEEIKIKAEFYNESLALITTPKISFKLTDEQKRTSNFEFGVTGNFYSLPLGTLKPGKYNWVASSTFGGKKHTKSGVFIVEDVAIESIDVTANHTLLKQIATNSNGKFYPLSKRNQLLTELKSREDIVEISFEESAFNDLLDFSWILLLLVGLLATEWFLRRRNGSY